ncbi:hypothetical protein A2Z67_02560 [Candidatus Woesebacteria bacterium RBG_13_36_22]|uniref:Uncharacterized protein n=1 Tax=Candidatus Woesebacteria bacterium RBG_13_36_22 TaxID=1802478 RepID=A0A1F7X1L8_9BACT|nr:MAG: hypothetical protein A2Z67_02560 [Candidatus Woesebacteria bacterium RBG_13_36_22]
MKIPLERHNIEGLFDIDGESEDQAIVCLDKNVEELEMEYISECKAHDECKKKYDETLRKLKDREDTSIRWSVEDFVFRAFELKRDSENWEEPEEDFDDTNLEDAKLYLKKYDPDKFEDALYDMMRHHDATIGITWDTVDIYLDEDCLKDKK